jgi:hypothetical protein
MQIQEHFVFWRIDTFPTFKWSKIKQVNDDGTIEPLDFPGLKVKAITVLPPIAAEAIIAQVTQIQGAHTSERTNLDAKYKNMVQQLFPSLL